MSICARAALPIGSTRACVGVAVADSAMADAVVEVGLEPGSACLGRMKRLLQACGAQSSNPVVFSDFSEYVCPQNLGVAGGTLRD